MRKLFALAFCLAFVSMGTSNARAVPMDLWFNVDPGSTLNVTVDGVGDLGTVDMAGSARFSVDGDMWWLEEASFTFGDLLDGLVIDVSMAYPFTGSTGVHGVRVGDTLTFDPSACTGCTNFESLFHANALVISQIVEGVVSESTSFAITDQGGLLHLESVLAFTVNIIAPANVTLNMGLTQVPEPGTFALAAGGLIALAVVGRKRVHKA